MYGPKTILKACPQPTKMMKNMMRKEMVGYNAFRRVSDSIERCGNSLRYFNVLSHVMTAFTPSSVYAMLERYAG